MRYSTKLAVPLAKPGRFLSHMELVEPVCWAKPEIRASPTNMSLIHKLRRMAMRGNGVEVYVLVQWENETSEDESVIELQAKFPSFDCAA
ncbi:hypothetical protein Tco_0974174 [Tanacetum coccineum]|uniref:Chromo domain-containing protein n=1 Tax=Tanacetum coccineum TaxID=301880 RepID=A0ABQ5EAZ7_9ASTR